MIKHVLTLCLVVSAWSICSAQDPGFRPAQPANQQPALSGGGTASDVKSAGLINSMDQLDNTTPLQPDYQVSFRILEDRAEPIRLRVQDSGDIQAPHVGLVRAQGKTCREVALAVKAELEKSYYQKATVIIAIDVIPQTRGGTGPGGIARGVESYTVFGQVGRQGKYELPYDSDLSISQAILAAGGPAQFANLKKVKVIRKTKQGNKQILVDVDSIMTKGMLDRDIFIRNNDVLIIPEKVYNF